MLGADSVLTMDVHSTTLKLLQYGAGQAGSSDTIDTTILDLFSTESLPVCNMIVVADATRRCLETRNSDPTPVILVSDSQRFVFQFESDLNEKCAIDPKCADRSESVSSFCVGASIFNRVR
jgi:hypothetical protein